MSLYEHHMMVLIKVKIESKYNVFVIVILIARFFPLKVCDEQRCEEQVFPLAINYMDRFLCQCPISRQQFQLLGSVCLLLATKIRQCYALTADLLCAYTDFSVTPEEIRVREEDSFKNDSVDTNM